MFYRKSLILAAGLAAGLGLGFSGTAASAAALSPLAQLQVQTGHIGNVQLAQAPRQVRRQMRRDRRATRRAIRRYNRATHGPRYRARRGRYVHRYSDGYYYATPWWLGAAAVGAVIGSTIPRASAGGNAHVEWCLGQYRSYNPSTDTYRTYDGRNVYCNSPYR